MIEGIRTIRALLLQLAKLMGRFNTFVLLLISFYGILLPVSLLRRVFRSNKEERGWLKRDPLPKDHFQKQY
ncbi:hypothetical protein MYX65_02440 [Acidobacteria bacterium AH-259-L09]|nr:hypothetical protein [Acidobacteria bacterium AH-259-L09]